MDNYQGYKLERDLGRGATARIFLARHPETHEKVSLKIFHPKVFQLSGVSQRIQREVEISNQLTHPNIVRVRRLLEGDPPALEMDYIEGENLEMYQGLLPYVMPEVSVWIVIEILKALEYAHEKGVIHQDIKPENVLVSVDGHVYVTDFGLAKLRDSTMTNQSNVLMGSIDYMSPEQVRGEQSTEASDLFSVAGVLYFLTTGTRPFSRGRPLATLAAIKEEKVEPPHKRNPKLSASLVRIIERGLAKDPADRYTCALQFRQDLERFIEEVGLEEFSLAQWSGNKTATTLETLRVAADRLTARCELYLRTKQWNRFLEALEHLSLKAPESGALKRFTEAYQKHRRRRVPIYFAFGLGMICIVGGVGWLYSKATNPSALPPVTQVSPSFKPMGASLAPAQKQMSKVDVVPDKAAKPGKSKVTDNANDSPTIPSK